MGYSAIMADTEIGTQSDNAGLEQPVDDVLEQQHGLSTAEPAQHEPEQSEVAEADAKEQDTPIDQDDAEGWPDEEDRRMEA